ncbi:MAG TPA: sigma-70 family RNA polymerase sigma factor [Terriglobia bacterium]|nr:sigma-70 family RNA polymerase sigma factor [Terriglobia bacterium]
MSVPGQGILDEPFPIADTPTDDEMEAAVEEHSRLVYRIAYSALRNHHDAEDATQETFLRFLKHRHDWPRIRDRRGWLARTAWRVALDARRRPAPASLDEAAGVVATLCAAGKDAEEIAAHEETAGLLHHLIDGLPHELRETLMLSMIEEMSSAEVGEVLGIPPGSVRERLWRARQLLKEKLRAVLGKES